MRKDKTEYNEYMKVYMKDRYYRRRDAAVTELGGRCCKCGSTDSLEFDHVDYQDKKFNVGKIWMWSEAKYKAELSKCQLLCGKCHLAKSKMEGSLGDRMREKACVCGVVLHSTKSYAGHKRWCRHTGP